MNGLYKDGTYRCFARVHRRGMSQGSTHAGYAFLPWHRAFIALFEDALRLKDRDVSLPYWDSSLDGNMANESKYSVMWDNAHMGTGRGEVNEGPFAGWQTVKGNLTRNVGRGKGKLARQDSINYLLTLCSFDKFSKELEKIHNGIHKWLGGAMKGSLAAFDPLFYMHHAFIDVIWEKFRQRQRATCGVDPASDYPPAPVDSGAHAAEYYMFGMRFFKNIDGMADYWINNWYNYTDTPMCANNCSDSPDLYCDKDINMCASRSHVSFGDDGIVTDDGGYNKTGGDETGTHLRDVPPTEVIAADG
ncbi:putative tyrosinase-like protein tyr-3 isoform X2 [Dreissena polymorpha]|nr:putative tyrosinase-like protein tyr-3 isoform X2 [Dreissena polymorpha]